METVNPMNVESEKTYEELAELPIGSVLHDVFEEGVRFKAILTAVMEALPNEKHPTGKELGLGESLSEGWNACLSAIKTQLREG